MWGCLASDGGARRRTATQDGTGGIENDLLDPRQSPTRHPATRIHALLAVRKAARRATAGLASGGVPNDTVGIEDYLPGPRQSSPRHPATGIHALLAIRKAAWRAAAGRAFGRRSKTTPSASKINCRPAAILTATSSNENSRFARDPEICLASGGGTRLRTAIQDGTVGNEN